MSSTSHARQQSDPPSPPSRSDPAPTGSPRPGLNRTSILLIVAFLLCFTGFIYLSSKIPRITLTVQATSSRHRRQNGKRRKPKLWEVSLDDDPSNVLKHLVAMHNWRPVAAWPDKTPTLPRRRQNPLRPETVMSHQVAIAQTWVHGSVPIHSAPHQVQFPAPPPPPPPPRPVPNPSVLNVAVLIAMPSQREQKDTQSDHGSLPRPPIKSGLSYDDGQLLFGVARLPCKEQAVCTAPTQSGRTT